jgi:sugar phosphate isomerase/epimerase
MTTYRDSLPPGNARDRYDAATAAAGAASAAAWRELRDYAAEYGIRAAAERAVRPGGLSADEIGQRLEQMRDERQRAA